jgi:hypothetical protein
MRQNSLERLIDKKVKCEQIKKTKFVVKSILTY